MSENGGTETSTTRAEEQQNYSNSSEKGKGTYMWNGV